MADTSNSTRPAYNKRAGEITGPLTSPLRGKGGDSSSADLNESDINDSQSRYSADDLRNRMSTLTATDQGMPIDSGQESDQSKSRRELNIKGSGKNTQKSKLDKSFIAMVVFIAVVFDVIEFATGGFVGFITTPIAGLLFYLIFKSKGIEMKGSLRMGSMLLGPVINVIPILGALPAWVAQVLVIIGTVKAEEKLGIK